MAAGRFVCQQTSLRAGTVEALGAGMGSVAWLIDGDWRGRRLMAVRPVCVDHMTLPVGDLERSVAFYRAALVGGMGWVERTIDGSPTFGPAGAEDVSLVAGGPLAPPIHLAFAATSYEQIAGFHREGLAAGGRDHGAPGPRPKYSPGYYGAFLLDPTGTTSRPSGTRPTRAETEAPDES